jgi:hypothetical protein
MKIEVGQWYRNGAGHIVFCLAKNPYTTDYPWVMVSHNGFDTEVESYQIDGTYSSSPYLEGIEDLEDWNIVEHLPDCTGFDWVPKPKLQLREGAWYKRKDGKIVGPCAVDPDQDDYCTHFNYKWVVGSWRYRDDGTNAVESTQHLECEVPDPTPKPVYRPFANAEEFSPHRDRWIGRMTGSTPAKGYCKVVGYEDAGVWIDSRNLKTYREWFEDGRTFEDGTPFGVKVS